MPFLSGFTLLLLMAPAPERAPAMPLSLTSAASTIDIGAVGRSTGLQTPRFQALAFSMREHEQPRLSERAASHDPFQFAGVRALRFDRGRYRPSPIDAKLEFRTNGESSSVEVGGAVSRLLRRALQ